MISDQQLKALFRAFAERQDPAFLKVAETIIAEELAANHHSLATELSRALELPRGQARDRATRKQMTSLPRDRRNGDNLVSLQEGQVAQDQIVLGDAVCKKIDRILDEHRKRDSLAKYGYSPKNKILFWGPPGCGKTYTAHYLAHELGLRIGIIRLNAVISSFLGDTASHLQRVFDLAQATPMVLLLDEADAVAKARDDPNDVGELKRVVNSLLQAMDSFRSRDSVIIAASNHQYLLDPAVWRRFDDIVHFPLPGRSDREKHLRLLLNGVEFQGSFPNLAKGLTSLSYGDIERIVLEAVKTVILQGMPSLCSSEITEQLRAFKQNLAEAQEQGAWHDNRGAKK